MEFFTALESKKLIFTALGQTMKFFTALESSY
jgi:hypothetical protein